MNSTLFRSLSLLALACTSVGVSAAANVVVNGGFEATTNGAGQLGGNTDATGWTNAGFNFVIAPGTGDTTGAYSSQFNAPVSLWGPANGSANGFTAASPAGGNFVAADGAFEVGPLSQTLTGLTAGKDFRVTFYWAGAQQFGFNGPTTERWDVSLGGQTFSTNTVAIGDHGFSGWQKASFVFTPTSSTAVLTFLAKGTPDGLPPFSLLDGVTGSAVPEASTWAMLIVGFGLVGAASRRRTPMAVSA
jgi:hypothetical protein